MNDRVSLFVAILIVAGVSVALGGVIIHTTKNPETKPTRMDDKRDWAATKQRIEREIADSERTYKLKGTLVSVRDTWDGHKELKFKDGTLVTLQCKLIGTKFYLDRPVEVEVYEQTNQIASVKLKE